MAQTQNQTHLMIVPPQTASMIMTGQKLVEARLGTDRHAPYGLVAPGDTIYIKPASQRVIAKAIAHRVDQYEGLDPNDLEHLRSLYEDRVLGGDEFWDAKADAKFATFITLGKVTLLRDEAHVPALLLGPSHSDWRVLSWLAGDTRQAA